MAERSFSLSGSRTSSLSRRSGGWGMVHENVFTGESRSRNDSEFDDEEALKWAALERLPTYDRLRTTILDGVNDQGGAKEPVDLRSLSQNKLRTELLDKLFNDTADSENAPHTFLRRLRERIDKAGVSLPTAEVHYDNLNIAAKVHVGGRALPTLVNSAVNAFEGFMRSLGINWAKKTEITILSHVSGIIKPGRMTLLLGPPSSGKTSLLLALADKLDKTLKVEGEVTYNGYKLNLLKELYKRETELGIHPEADVDYFMKASTMEETFSSVTTDYVMKILGLDICADTIVGNALVRGISVGQKKRVTTGEMMVGPMKTLFMDEISTGLDSSTTFQIVRYLSDITHFLDHTILISLLQPAPETFKLFDDVILLSEGQIVYHGPIQNVLGFFESCGFKCPERKGVADFLQEVTSWKDQEQYWVDKSKPYQFVPVTDFAEAFAKSADCLKMAEELKVPFDKSKSHKGALSFKRFTLSSF